MRILPRPLTPYADYILTLINVSKERNTDNFCLQLRKSLSGNIHSVVFNWQLV